MKRQNVKSALDDLLREGGEASAGRLAARVGATRQSAHLWLRDMVARGELVRIGAGRSTRYRRPLPIIAQGSWPRAGLDEDVVWRELAPAIRRRVRRRAVVDILQFAFTEMVNNAIDHSRGRTVSVRVFESPTAIGFEVEDDGVGIFAHVMRTRRLRSPFDAIAQLQKGKLTTMPRAHTGQGIFFTARLADHMLIESGRTRWVIDGRRDDQSIETVPLRHGTLVRFEIDRASRRTVASTFRRFTNADLDFSRTRTTVRLLREGESIVSRSEAKRLLAGLERFEEVELDFRGVRGIGQGFADEVFRIWQRDHPATRLVVRNASPAVRFIVGRAQRDLGRSPSG